MDRILLPLRSNVGWFTNADTHAVLQSRLKNYLITFDSIAVQNGWYSAVFWKNKTHVEFMIPPAAIRFDRTPVGYFNPEHEPFLMVDGHALAEGAAEASFTVDFLPLLKEAGIHDAEYVEWVNGDIDGVGSAKVKALLDNDVRRSDVPSELQMMSAERRAAALKALLTDTVIAEALRIPFATDFHAGPLIKWHNADALQELTPDLRSKLYEEWTLLGLPDFADADWSEVHRVRESTAGRDYRTMLRRVEGEVIDAVANAAAPVDVRAIIRHGLMRELIYELRAMTPSLKSAAINFGWNFVPILGSVLNGASDLRTLAGHRHSWISMVSSGEFRD